MTAYLVYKELISQQIKTRVDFFGKGPELEKIKELASSDGLEEGVHLWGNVPAEQVKQALKESHFLVFASQSEGWPKVVAESMFWGCIPITTPVSCVPQMLNHGERGFLLGKGETADRIIRRLLESPEEFEAISEKASRWSRTYTLEYFEEEIAKLL